ncbi:uncharacterized protein LOC142224464 [Haematobia irritans]|uniref:uncharacterized protein LOC142224464 n=1 Tax=Haematobia irritans TaxID=7368 RepID=UPI003F4FF06C
MKHLTFNIWFMVLLMTIQNPSFLWTTAIEESLKDYNNANKYGDFIMDIYQEQSFDSILLFYRNWQRANDDDDDYMKIFHEQLRIPIISINNDGRPFIYHDFYNSNILVILLMNYGMDLKLLETTAQVLSYIRQSRIIIMAENMEDKENFQMEFLELCEQYKMTKVFLIFSEENFLKKCLTLKPYPDYHWQTWSSNQNQHFSDTVRLDLHNKTLITYIDQTSIGNLVFIDAQGQIQLRGFVSKLVLLFAKRHNASLDLLQPLKIGDTSPFQLINQMTMDNLIDIPMGLSPIPHTKARNSTDFYDINQLLILVPLAQHLSTQEIYGILLNEYFFMCIVGITLLVSILHAAIDYWAYGREHKISTLCNMQLLPGVLGLSFPLRSTNHWLTLRILYLLVGFVGLYIGILFAAKNNANFTTPPSQPEIRNFNDLRQSSVKLLCSEADYALFANVSDIVRDSIMFSKNLTYIQEQRMSFNPSYCYGATTTTYDIIWRQQMFWSRPTFHIPKDMIILDLLPWGYLLPYNSPYKEPLNRLIHDIHSAGLVKVWQDELFFDLLQLKQVSIEDRNPSRGPKELKVGDLYWVWMIVIVGLSSGSLIFLSELGFYYCYTSHKKDCK